METQTAVNLLRNAFNVFSPDGATPRAAAELFSRKLVHEESFPFLSGNLIHFGSQTCLLLFFSKEDSKRFTGLGEESCADEHITLFLIQVSSLKLLALLWAIHQQVGVTGRASESPLSLRVELERSIFRLAVHAALTDEW